MPHHDVYVRLQPSPIHGLGVFAIRTIPKGARIFTNDHETIVRVPTSTVRTLDREARRFYEDFCAVEDGEYLCPRSFNELNVSWYLNHGDEPNVTRDSDETFVAARRIRRGEELTADYRTYCEDPFPWLGRRAATGTRRATSAETGMNRNQVGRRRTGRAVEKLSWGETVRGMAASRQDWNAWDAAVADGLDDLPWMADRKGGGAEPPTSYRAKPRPSNRR